jgi:DNA-binding LytR/AlgR family response regulator
LLVKTAKGMLTLPIEEVAYIYIDSQMVFVKTTSNQRFALEKTLDELEKQLDPSKFFRLNRQFIVSVKAINAIHNYFNNTLKIELKPPIDREIIVSRYTVKSFKDWLDS